MKSLLIRALLVGLFSFTLTYAVLRAFGNPFATPVPAGNAPAAGVQLATAQTREDLETRWEALLPKGWDTQQAFLKAMDNLSEDEIARINDEDPRSEALMKKLRAAWDAAPVNPAAAGRSVRLAGFIMPIADSIEGGMGEFLLAPYLGTDIHTPPPPANQLVRVTVRTPLPPDWVMMPVWVEGTLQVGKQRAPMGTSGYSIANGLVSTREEALNIADE